MQLERLLLPSCISQAAYPIPLCIMYAGIPCSAADICTLFLPSMDDASALFLHRTGWAARIFIFIVINAPRSEAAASPIMASQ